MGQIWLYEDYRQIMSNNDIFLSLEKFIRSFTAYQAPFNQPTIIIFLRMGLL